MCIIYMYFIKFSVRKKNINNLIFLNLKYFSIFIDIFYFQAGHRLPRYSIVNWAVCTPASCNFKDVETSLHDILTRYTSQTGLKITVKVNKEMCQVKRKSIPNETMFVR